MSQQIIDQLLTIINNNTWPTAHRDNSKIRRYYEHGLDIVRCGSGTVQNNLVTALEIFHATQSAPYACAGIAATLAEAGMVYEKGAETKEPALHWLEKAQDWEPDKININLTEGLIYAYADDFENSRLILDYLHSKTTDNYHLALGEIRHWWKSGDDQQYEDWIRKSYKLADNDLKTLHALRLLAQLYNKYNQPAEALKYYKKCLEISPKNPELWHNMSCILFDAEQYKEAAKYNQKTLELADFYKARYMKEQIEKKTKFSLKGLFQR